MLLFNLDIDLNFVWWKCQAVRILVRMFKSFEMLHQKSRGNVRFSFGKSIEAEIDSDWMAQKTYETANRFFRAVCG
jgi:hypothetical protein